MLMNQTYSSHKIEYNKHVKKKCSMSLTIKEMQIKTPLRFQHNTVKIAIIRQTEKSAGECVGV